MSGAAAQRYASALADVALEHKDADGVKRDLASFVEAFYSSPELRNFLDNPSVNPELKQRAVEKITEVMKLVPAVRNFIRTVVDHQRTGMLREIEKAFGDELNARLGIAEAEVVSARELSAAEKKDVDRGAGAADGKEDHGKFSRRQGVAGRRHRAGGLDRL